MTNSLFRISFALGVLLCTALCLNSCLFIPEDKEGSSQANQRPEVRIVSGASTKEPVGVDYRVQFRWSATDSDGSVVRYEYATDDTSGSDAWHSTSESGVSIVFSATEPDDNYPGTSADWHSFHLRAIDDNGATSRVASQRFNARTIEPTSRITFPAMVEGVRFLPSNVVIRWDGQDLDATSDSQSPIAWEYKLAYTGHVLFDEPAVDSLYHGRNLFVGTEGIGARILGENRYGKDDDRAGLNDQAEVRDRSGVRIGGEGDPTQWTRVDASVRSVTLPAVEAKEPVLFGVRAIDEAGATESSLRRNENYFWFLTHPEVDLPIVTVNEPALGSFVFDRPEEVWELKVPSGQELRFQWRVDAAHYGGEAGPADYALDHPNPDDEELSAPDGIGGWIGWDERFELDTPFKPGDLQVGQHEFVLKVRDATDRKDAERTCRVRVEVVPFTMERPLLIMDDSRFPTLPPSDSQHDAFLMETLLADWLDDEDADLTDLYGAGDVAPSGADTLTLADFGRYQHIVWHFQVAPNTPWSNLFSVETRRGLLSAYLSGGGRLWMIGGRITSSFGSISRPGGDFTYPKDAPNGPGDPDADFGLDSFIYRFMKMRSEIVSVASRGPGSSVQRRQASGLIGVKSLHGAFPDLPLDLSKRDPFQVVNGGGGPSFRGGITDWEGYRSSRRDRLELPGREPLYGPTTMDTTLQFGEIRAGFDDAVIAWRYASTAADTAALIPQGRTVVLDFQPYWFEPEPLREAGRSLTSWLRTGADN